MASMHASFTFHLILETLEQKACPLFSMILFCDNSGVWVSFKLTSTYFQGLIQPFIVGSPIKVGAKLCMG